jgi:pimeloyl-ACP methyl ester carboxylesterase
MRAAACLLVRSGISLARACLAAALVVGVWVGLSFAVNSLKRQPEPKATSLRWVGHNKFQIHQMTQKECEAETGRIWLVVDQLASCIAYIVSPGPISGHAALLLLDGDAPGEMTAPEQLAARLEATRRLAEHIQGLYGLPVVAIERPGNGVSTDSSLGRGTRGEGKIIHAAIDALKQRYGFRRLALAGQSGGATVGAHLLVLGRRDIVCAVMASGRYGMAKMASPKTVWSEADIKRRFTAPLLDAESIAHQPERRAFIIGDPRDTVASFEEQRKMPDKMRALGHHAELIEAVAPDHLHHGLLGAAVHVAGMCATGRSDQDIRDFIAAW